MKNNTSYRETLGFQDPPPGTVLKLEYMAGINWCLIWEEAPDGEDIVAGWMSKKKAQSYARDKGWEIETIKTKTQK